MPSTKLLTLILTTLVLTSCMMPFTKNSEQKISSSGVVLSGASHGLPVPPEAQLSPDIEKPLPTVRIKSISVEDKELQDLIDNRFTLQNGESITLTGTYKAQKITSGGVRVEVVAWKGTKSTPTTIRVTEKGKSRTLTGDYDWQMLWDDTIETAWFSWIQGLTRLSSSGRYIAYNQWCFECYDQKEPLVNIIDLKTGKTVFYSSDVSSERIAWIIAEIKKTGYPDWDTETHRNFEKDGFTISRSQSGAVISYANQNGINYSATYTPDKAYREKYKGQFPPDGTPEVPLNDRIETVLSGQVFSFTGISTAWPFSPKFWGFVGFSPDGKYLMYSLGWYEYGAMRIVDARTGKEIITTDIPLFWYWNWSDTGGIWQLVYGIGNGITSSQHVAITTFGETVTTKEIVSSESLNTPKYKDMNRGIVVGNELIILTTEVGEYRDPAEYNAHYRLHFFDLITNTLLRTIEIEDPKLENF